jgi:hypothetical protein
MDAIRAHEKEIGAADLVIIWRAPLTSDVSFAIDLARRNDARIVFDVDDLMVDPALAKLELIDGRPY